MTVIVQKKRSQGYAIPSGGEVLWYGIASLIPAEWDIDTYAADVFIRGADVGQSNNTPASSNSHSHTNPANTGSEANHTHPIGGGNSSGASGGDNFFPAGDQGTASDNHNHSINLGTSAAGGGHSHTLSSVNSLEVYPPYHRLYWIKASVEAAIPVGGIIMWDRPAVNIPTEFIICDGQVGTPDLRDKFIYAAAADEDVGITGGADTHAHVNPNTGAGGSHIHGLSVGSGNSGSNNNGSDLQGIQVSGAHDHSASVDTDSDANHTHSVPNTGNGTNLPAYLKLYFIMRLA